MIDLLFRFLKSVGFDEPLHPPITHLPIGLIMGGTVFFILAIVFKVKSLIITARHASILALVFAFPTILLGVIDWIHFYNGALIQPIIIKMILASTLLIVLGIGIIMGSEIKLYTIRMAIIWVICFLLVVGLGYEGAGLIYGRGVTKKSSTTQNVTATSSPKSDTLTTR